MKAKPVTQLPNITVFLFSDPNPDNEVLIKFLMPNCLRIFKCEENCLVQMARNLFAPKSLANFSIIHVNRRGETETVAEPESESVKFDIINFIISHIFSSYIWPSTSTFLSQLLAMFMCFAM